MPLLDVYFTQTFFSFYIIKIFTQDKNILIIYIKINVFVGKILERHDRCCTFSLIDK